MPDEVIIVDAAGTEHHFPAGFDPKQAGEIVRQRTAAAAPAAEPSYLSQVGERFTGGLKRAVHNPAVGAGLATTVAAPFTGGLSLLPAAATMFGAGTAGALATGADIPTAAKEGAYSAAGEGIGRGVMAGARKVGRLIYRTAMRPSMGLQREFPDVIDTGLREGARVSEGGHGKIAGKLRASADEANTMIADAQAAGAAPIPTKEVASEFGDVFKQGRRQAQLGRPDPRPAVLQRLQAFDTKHPGGIPLDTAQPLKGEAQDLASRAYRAQDLGHPITDLSAASDEAMARGLRKGIEARVPGVGKVNAHTQSLMGVDRALEDALRRNVPGLSNVRALLGDFIPATASSVGIGLDRTGRSQLTPAAFRTALLAALGQQQE